MKSAIVTGATGFIGTWLVKELSSNGIKVTAVVRQETKNLIKIKDILNVELVKCDMDQIDKLSDILHGESYDVFYHLAWNGSSGDLRSDYETQLTNVEITLKAMAAAEKLKCTKFVGAGSLMEFESHQVVMKDGIIPTGSNIYSIAKYTAHAMSKTYSSNMEIEHVWAYITNAYGEDEISPRFFNTTIRKMLDRENLDFTEGLQLYDFVHVSDVARAFRLIGEKGKRGCNYCIGSGNPKPLKEFIIKMGHIVDDSLQMNFGAVASTGISLSADIYSIENLKEDTGYEPLISFDEGVNRVLAYMKEQIK